MTKLLIAEDDLEIAMLERDYLEIEGYQVSLVDNGQQAVTQALNGGYDLILLDLMLPGCSGCDVCRLIRDKIDVPILMVTARSEPVDKIRGLGLGADDYIAKPFDPAELVARVKAHLRRYARLTGGGPAEAEVIQLGSLQIFPQSWRVVKNGQEIKCPTGNLRCSSIWRSTPTWSSPRKSSLRPSGGTTMWGTAQPSPSISAVFGTRWKTIPPILL